MLPPTHPCGVRVLQQLELERRLQAVQDSEERKNQVSRIRKRTASSVSHSASTACELMQPLLSDYR